MQILSTLLTIGLPAIDESLDKLLVAMETFPNVAVLGDAVSLARVIGLCLALCVGSYECWMMMLGRRGMDVMNEAAPHRWYIHLHLLLIVDMRRLANARQGSGERDQGDGAGQEQGSCAEAGRVP